MKTIFSKYSNERCPQFCIKTIITKDENGNRYVRKYPYSYLAQEHIDKLPFYCDKINKFYGNVGFRAAKCVKKENSVIFEYIEGITFEEKLEQASDNINIIFQLINDLKNALINSEYTKPFVRSENFDFVFGSEVLPDNLHAMDFTCFDLAFNNLIINNDIFCIIDYEWCFDFPVPIEYIIYRALKLYIVLNNKNELLNKDIYGYLGFDKYMISVFDKLEENFQNYVHKGAFITRELYEKYKGKNYNINEIMALSDEKEERCWAQTYIDYGNGYNENDSYKRLFRYGEEMEINIALTKDARACRFPEFNSCIMVTSRIVACSKYGMYDPEYSTNGCESHGVIYFTQEDPQIIFDNLREGTTAIQLKCRIYPLSGEHIDGLAKAVFDNKELSDIVENQKIKINNLEADVVNLENVNNEINNKLNERINALSAEIVQKEQYISAIENSRAWKIVCRLRRVLGR